jgi:aspartyl/glutamyl-tRNA(Asn/Gln) amidotransferase C subunit
MTEEIDKETFSHLVALGALEFEPGEAEYLRRELNNQLAAVRELAAVPLDDDTDPTYHGVPYTAQTSPPIREDAWVSCPNPEDILAQAPFVEDGYIVVPDIPHEQLD